MGLEISCDDPNADLTPRKLTPEQYEQNKADAYNFLEGHLNDIDGYDCPICKNKGNIMKVKCDERGFYYESAMDCKCMKSRIAIRRLKASGLEKFVRDCTFDKYDATETWQIVLKQAAMDYARNPIGWFFIGGQTGTGKTHLCTAICRELLLDGYGVVYMPWRTEAVKIKSFINDSEVYETMVNPLKNADVLYIDDLFKTAANEGEGQKPTAGDINLAFAIINYRYTNNLPTIITSESTSPELLSIDEATGGRLVERAKNNFYDIAKDRSKNYRLKGVTTL